jgi:hypothetical protein
MEKKKRNSPVRLLVLDVLKPHKPNIVELCKLMCSIDGVDSSDISVYAVDEKTESIKMIIEGYDINFENVRNAIEKKGAVVHSIDRTVVGSEEYNELYSAPKD